MGWIDLIIATCLILAFFGFMRIEEKKMGLMPNNTKARSIRAELWARKNENGIKALEYAMRDQINFTVKLDQRIQKLEDTLNLLLDHLNLAIQPPSQSPAKIIPKDTNEEI